MTFGQPLWFWALLFIPVVLVTFLVNESRRAAHLQKLVASRLMPKLAGNASGSRRWTRFILQLLGFAFIVSSLAQPQFGYTWQQSKRQGRDVLIAIDTSRSMLANDLAPNRLTRAKLAAQDLIAQLEGDRVGLIAFAGTAFLQAPLTVDYSAVLGAMNELDSEIIPHGGSNIAEAIRTAVEAFGKGESEHRALIIFSDGEELDADAIEQAKSNKDSMRIFTVGLGTTDGALIPLPSHRGASQFVKDASGQIVKSRLDEKRLREIAELTQGFYVHLLNGQAEMQQIVRDGLGKMSEQDIDAKVSRQPIERYRWPLTAGIACLVMSLLIGERRRPATQPTVPNAKTKMRVPAAAVMLMAALLPISATAKNRGVEAYEREDYQAANDEFSRQLQRQPNSPALQFNLGSAAYKRGEYDKALEAFSKALPAKDPGLRAKAAYNIGNTLFQRGSAQKEKEAKLSEWKNALQHYDDALKVSPSNEDAVYNRELLKKMIAELEKEPPKDQQQEKDKNEQNKDKQDQKDQNQQQQQKDQQQKQDQNKEGEKDQNDPQKGDGDEQKQQEGEGDKEGNQPPRDEKNGEGKDGQDKQKEGQQPQDKKEGEGQKPEPTPAQGENKKKEGEIKSAPQYSKKEEGDKNQQEAEAMAAAAGKMTESQAKNLLDSLKNEDDRVRLIDPRERKMPPRVIRDW